MQIEDYELKGKSSSLLGKSLLQFMYDYKYKYSF